MQVTRRWSKRSWISPDVDYIELPIWVIWHQSLLSNLLYKKKHMEFNSWQFIPNCVGKGTGRKTIGMLCTVCLHYHTNFVLQNAVCVYYLNVLLYLTKLSGILLDPKSCAWSKNRTGGWMNALNMFSIWPVLTAEEANRLFGLFCNET